MSKSLSVAAAAGSNIDYTPLLRRLAFGETRRFIRRARAEQTSYPAIAGPGLSDILAALGALVVTIPLISLELLLLASALSGVGGAVPIALISVVSIAATAGCLYLIWRAQPLLPLVDDRWNGRLRLAEFAAINNFEHVTQSPARFAPLDAQALPGTEVATDRLMPRGRLELEIGNLSYHVHSWEQVTEVHTGYLAMESPPNSSPAMIETLQRSVDAAGLGVRVAESGPWIVLHSSTRFDLLAPQTYRVLFWIAAQTDRRRGEPQPISAQEFLAESKQLAKSHESQTVKWFFMVTVAVSAVWLVAFLGLRLLS